MSPVEKATIHDVPQIHKLVNYFADKYLVGVGESIFARISEIKTQPIGF